MTLDKLAGQIRCCMLCPLCESRNLAVPGEGPANARLVLIGEAPGASEDRTGRPFVGPAGKLLDQMLISAGIDRRETFITNIVKCRPPRNRVPRRVEIETCTAAYLYSQLRELRPALICLLGATATRTLLGEQAVGRVRGRLITRDWRILATYHPSAAARNPRLATLLQHDLRKVANFLRGTLPTI